MSYENWKNKAQGFQTVDVRHIQGSFFEGLKKRAEALEVGEGLHIIQTFEPHPLYTVMEALGLVLRSNDCIAHAVNFVLVSVVSLRLFRPVYCWLFYFTGFTHHCENDIGS